MRPNPIADTSGPSLPRGRVGRVAIVENVKLTFNAGKGGYENGIEIFSMICFLISK